MPTPSVEPAATGLGPDLVAIAAGIATPVDAYGPVRAYCEVREGAFGVAFGRDGGRVNEPAGPVLLRPRLAIDLADLLNARLVDVTLSPNMKMAAAHVLAAAKPEVHHDRAAPTP